MSYKVFSAGTLRELADPNAEAKLFRAASERYWVNMVTKDHAPQVKSELHDTEADIYVVLDGEADLYLGGTLVDPTSPRPGQQRGSGLEGAEKFHVAKGDVIVIPEQIAHMLDASASCITYLVVKEEVVK